MGLWCYSDREIALYLKTANTYIGEKMGKMNVVLPDETEEKFRKAVFERKGMKKGNISDALVEAIDQWINSCETLQPEGKKHGK